MIYGNILAPIDGSEIAARGLQEAIRLAKDQGARIQLLHIVSERVLLASNAYGSDMGTVFEALVMGGESLLDEAEAAAQTAGVEVDNVLFEAKGGRAGARIVKKAVEWPADLIVCGTHGRHGIRRMVLCSDAE